jgi:hypothetical protein
MARIQSWIDEEGAMVTGSGTLNPRDITYRAPYLTIEPDGRWFQNEFGEPMWVPTPVRPSERTLDRPRPIVASDTDDPEDSWWLSLWTSYRLWATLTVLGNVLYLLHRLNAF